MVKCYTKQRKDGTNYTTCNKNIEGNKPKPKPKVAVKQAVAKIENKKYSSYTIEQLKRGAKNWAKVKRVKIKGINNISRNGLEKLFVKEKISLDFLKFNIKENKSLYAALEADLKGEKPPKQFFIDKKKPFKN